MMSYRRYDSGGPARTTDLRFDVAADSGRTGGPIRLGTTRADRDPSRTPATRLPVAPHLHESEIGATPLHRQPCRPDWYSQLRSRRRQHVSSCREPILSIPTMPWPVSLLTATSCAVRSRRLLAVRSSGAITGLQLSGKLTPPIRANFGLDVCARQSQCAEHPGTRPTAVPPACLGPDRLLMQPTSHRWRRRRLLARNAAMDRTLT